MSEKINVRASVTELGTWIGDIRGGGFVQPDGTSGSGLESVHHFNTKAEAQKAADLYEAKQSQTVPETRQFESGATRDTATGKLSYVKALSPIVLRRYLQYMLAHRKQSDGTMRDFDNWKNGIPQDTYLDGLVRHCVDLWLLMDGFDAQDNHGPCNLEDLLCAIVFNASGALHELLKKEIAYQAAANHETGRNKQTPGGY